MASEGNPGSTEQIGRVKLALRLEQQKNEALRQQMTCLMFEKERLERALLALYQKLNDRP